MVPFVQLAREPESVNVWCLVEQSNCVEYNLIKQLRANGVTCCLEDPISQLNSFSLLYGLLPGFDLTPK
jgi:hypothetical protein